MKIKLQNIMFWKRSIAVMYRARLHETRSELKPV